MEILILVIVLGIMIAGYKLIKAGNDIDLFSKYRKEKRRYAVFSGKFWNTKVVSK